MLKNVVRSNYPSVVDLVELIICVLNRRFYCCFCQLRKGQKESHTLNKCEDTHSGVIVCLLEVEFLMKKQDDFEKMFLDFEQF